MNTRVVAEYSFAHHTLSLSHHPHPQRPPKKKVAIGGAKKGRPRRPTFPISCVRCFKFASPQIGGFLFFFLHLSLSALPSYGDYYPSSCATGQPRYSGGPSSTNLGNLWSCFFAHANNGTLWMISMS